MYQITSATGKIAKMSARIRAVQGGTSASKTVSIMLYLIDRCQRDLEPTLTSVVSETMPHLKKGAIRDFLGIMEGHKYYRDERWNRTDFIYTFETGSRLEFFSADQPDKVRGHRRDRLFINECNNCSYDTFDQMEVRTKEFIFLDWNPTTDFWFYERVKGRDDCEHMIVTYRDNEALDPAIIRSIEQRKGNARWWKCYGEGLLGEVESRIYKGWLEVDEVPHEARLERYGLDFGYSNDPTVVVGIYYMNGGYIVDEVVHRKGMSNKEIADLILSQELKALVIADSAEPKSIDEIKSYGVSIVPAVKGSGSVLQGIQYVQDQRMSITKRSVNLIKDYRCYVWKTDKDGKVINEPDHFHSDGCDAIRYGLNNLITISLPSEEDEARVLGNRMTSLSRQEDVGV